MLIAFIVVAGLALLILGHEAGHFFAAKFFGMKVDEFGFGFPPRIFARRRGETDYSFNWLPFGGFVKIAGENDRLGDPDAFARVTPEAQKRMFFFQSAWKRSVVILAGVCMNLLLGWILLSSLFMIGIPSLLVVQGVQPGSPAEAAGLKEGDIIEGYGRASDFIAFTGEHRGETIEIPVTRGEEKLTFVVSLRSKDAKEQGALGVFLGESGVPKESFFGAIKNGFLATWEISIRTAESFIYLIRDLFVKQSVPEGVVGPVGIFGVAQDAGKAGLIYLLQLLAIISINLAVINLLPFPALDGGRFILIILEKIKGSPLPRTFEGVVNGLGFVFLILLMVLITARDVARLL